MIYKQLNTNNAGILIWQTEESEQELKNLLPASELYEKELNNLSSPKRRLEFLASRVALNALAGKRIDVSYTSEGKPVCISENLHISISHSGKWIAVMMHPTNAVGIDIEIPTDKFEKLYKRFLNPEEQAHLYSPAGLHKIQLAWSAKEALYKIIGAEAVNFDKQLEIKPFELNNEGLFIGIHTITGKTYQLNYIADEHFNLVYCID